LEEHKIYERQEDDYRKNLTFSPYVSEKSKRLAMEKRLAAA